MSISLSVSLLRPQQPATKISMKREYTDPKNHNNTNNPQPMFSNLPRHLLQPYSTSSSPPIHLHHHQHQHPFPFSVVSRDDEISSTGGGGGGGGVNITAVITTQPPNSDPTRKKDNDGASIEVQRRPRGRPPGSKNKPKPPVIITRELLPDPIMSPYILEISNSADVIDSIAKFSRRRNTGLCILHASGAVANVTIRQPSPNSSSAVTFHGRFDILSLDATFLSQTTSSQITGSNANNLNVAVSLSIPQGQIIGGIVAGPLIAAGTVYVIATSFSNPSFQRLPLEEDETTMKNVNSITNTNQTTSSGGQSASAGDNNNGGGGGMYSNSCNIATGSDVIWAPPARQPF